MNLVIDIGGTHVRIAATNDFETINEVEKFRTPKDIPTLKQAILESVQKLTQNQTIENVCVGIPGIVDETTKTFVSVPNIPNLNGQKFSSILDFSQKLLVVKNDALLAALGEAAVGAGKDFECVAYLTLSTGVGGARIVSKMIDETYKFFEPGHQIINCSGKSYESCGQQGCLESFVSGTAFEQIYKMKPQDCTDQKIWDEYAKDLSYGLTNIIALWAPDVIVLGGSVSNQFNHFIAPLQQQLANQKVFKIPSIVKSETMDKAALYGGLFHLKFI